jgi:Tfp pilus assembly protein PilZ
MNERRGVRRRTLPFLRGGVLHVGQRSHIVTIADLSPGGAYLATRVDVPDGEDVRLSTVLPRTGSQVTLPCEVVWRNDRFDPDTGRPAGMAVRFVRNDDTTQQHLESISAEGLFPLPVALARDRIEYRVVEKPELDVEELNQLGRDGWTLASLSPSPERLRLIFYRRM